MTLYKETLCYLHNQKAVFKYEEQLTFFRNDAELVIEYVIIMFLSKTEPTFIIPAIQSVLEEPLLCTMSVFWCAHLVCTSLSLTAA